jgi:hypothetical protein
VALGAFHSAYAARNFAYAEKRAFRKHSTKPVRHLPERCKNGAGNDST